jgi:3-phenylpropionate/trans-cinnamate dioxygenase ferredoxin subunit
MEVKVASTNDIPKSTMIGVESGGQKLLVANINGSYYSIGNICTHRGCMLSEGTLKGDNVQCPCHGSVFDVKSGALIKGPAKNPEKSFKVKVDGDKLLVDI